MILFLYFLNEFSALNAGPRPYCVGFEFAPWRLAPLCPGCMYRAAYQYCPNNPMSHNGVVAACPRCLSPTKHLRLGLRN